MNSFTQAFIPLSPFLCLHSGCQTDFLPWHQDSLRSCAAQELSGNGFPDKQDSRTGAVMPVGLSPPEVIVQLPSRVPETVYLKTLSVVLSLTTQILVPSVTRSLGLVLPLFRLKLLAAFWLPERRLAALV